MPHYTIAVFDGEDVNDQNIANIIRLLSKNGVKVIYNLEGKDLDLVDIKHYLKLVEPSSHEPH